MGSLFSAPKVPKPPAPIPLPPAAIPPTIANASVAGTGAAARARAAMAAGMGFGDTIKNPGGAQGLKKATTASKTLLG